MPYETMCAFSGFLLLQPGDREMGVEYHGSSVSIVDRVVSETTGAERWYPEYLRIFNRLKRLIKKRLVAPSVRVNSSGQEYVDSLTMWTQAAIAAHASGARFPCRPLLSR